jgi:hypothetical protein
MTSCIFLEDLTSQQLLRRLANQLTTVFGSRSSDTGEFSLNAQDRALFRSVLHRVAVTELWVTQMQFRQFFGFNSKGAVLGSSVRTHDCLMTMNPKNDREAKLYQDAYRCLTEYVAQHSDASSNSALSPAI